MSAAESEVWRPIPDAPGYEVSDRGRVRSWRMPNRRPIPPRYLTATLQPDGYLSAAVVIAGRRVTGRIHRLVAEAFLGPKPPGMHTRHLDGDKLNNTLPNLAYGTQSENELDKVRHGTHNHAKKTECIWGHALKGDNLILRPTGGRRCRECGRANKAKHLAKYVR